MYNFYPSKVRSTLREEFSDLIHGSLIDDPIGRPVILREVGADPCVCFQAQPGSPNPRCKYCQGEGYYWTERIIKAYLARNFGSVLGAATPITQQGTTTNYGLEDSHRAVAYCEADAIPDYEKYTLPAIKSLSKLYELKLDEDSDPVITPQGQYLRSAKWRIVSVTPHHETYGIIAYFELGLEKENL